MDDFGSVVYMDVQKSGSTYISQVLREVLDRQNFRRQEDHGRVRKRREDAIYFASVRHPLDSYHSLFRYGCDGNGNLAARLRKAGRGGLYQPSAEGFGRWLDFVLDEANAGALGEGYARTRADLFGFQTFRFMVLALASPLRRMAQVQSMPDLDALYDNERITSFVVRNEAMGEDLARLFSEHLGQHVNLDQAREVLARAPRINASKTGRLADGLDPRILAKLARKEEFLLRRFYS